MNKSPIMQAIALIVLLGVQGASLAAELSDLINYRGYSDIFSSSGQPSTEQLQVLADEGFERVIYLAYNDNDTAIQGEDRKVLDLGMEYIHIPVDFMKPTLRDFQHFAGVMQSEPTLKTLLHCQINLRASSFSFLYRVIHLDVPINEAAEDLQGVWAPNEIWFGFIESVAQNYGHDIHCDDCDWGGSEFAEE